MLTHSDHAHLQRALELAQLGRGRVSPNPLVGAVVVGDEEVLGEGYHETIGGPHAEVAAIAACRAAGNDPVAATLYVTLEPCVHHGRQPPCVDAILEAGIARVVIASEDPSDKANGRGPETLRDRGVEVVFADGEEAEAARLLNQPFRKHARTGRPAVMLKSAISLDGRTASASGDSRWISGPDSRARVHRWRSEVDAVAIGIGTALADDPLLTARDLPAPARRQPRRVIFDSAARLPLDSKLVGSVTESPVLVVARPEAASGRVAALDEAGVEVIRIGGSPAERVTGALVELGRRNVTSVLLEGGAELAGSFLDAGEVDELRLFLSPLVLGGARARPLLAGEGAPKIADAQRALSMRSERSGEDLLVHARLHEW